MACLGKKTDCKGQPVSPVLKHRYLTLLDVVSGGPCCSAKRPTKIYEAAVNLSGSCGGENIGMFASDKRAPAWPVVNVVLTCFSSSLASAESTTTDVRSRGFFPPFSPALCYFSELSALFPYAL